MDQKSTTMWVIVVIVVLVIIALGWWYFTQQGSLQGYSTTTQQSQSSQKDITAFVVTGLTPAVDSTIDNVSHTVSLMVPKGTDVTNLAPHITLSSYATVSPASDTAQDFTNPVVYTVIAQDGSAQSYTVTVTVSST